MPTRPAHRLAGNPHPAATNRPSLVASDRESLRGALVALLPELRARAVCLARDAAMADDLVQDTVERALRFADQYVAGTSLRAWAQQILFSVFVTRYRRARRDRNALRRLSGDPCAWTQPEPFPAPDADVALTPATRARIQALPVGFRAVIELVDLGELSYREAALQLGVPVGTVMSRLHRGRRLLADGLDRRVAASRPRREAA